MCLFRSFELMNIHVCTVHLLSSICITPLKESTEPYPTVTPGTVQNVAHTEGYEIAFVNMTPQSMPYLPPEVTTTTLPDSGNTGARTSFNLGILHDP